MKIKASDIGLAKHQSDSKTALGEFVNQGFVLYQDVFDQGTVTKVKEIVFAAYNRLIGNDLLTPLRTYGGFVGIDRRMGNIYTHTKYKAFTDYKSEISDLF